LTTIQAGGGAPTAASAAKTVAEATYLVVNSPEFAIQQ
jgi:hypothetical protein